MGKHQKTRRKAHTWAGLLSVLVVCLAPLLPEPCCCSGMTAQMSLEDHADTDASTARLPACCQARLVKKQCESDEGCPTSASESTCESCDQSTCECVTDATDWTVQRVSPAFEFDSSFETVDSDLSALFSVPVTSLPAQGTDVHRGRDLCVHCCRWLI